MDIPKLRTICKSEISKLILWQINFLKLFYPLQSEELELGKDFLSRIYHLQQNRGLIKRNLIRRKYPN